MRSRTIWWPAAAIAVLALAVRAYGLAGTPLWTDELFTRFYPGAGLGYLWGAGFRAEPTSPLYYTLIAGLEPILGSSAVALRLPSLIGSLAMVATAWLLGRELFDRRGPAIIGSLLLALAPVNVLFAQEARAYALQGAALGLALLGFARVLRGAPGSLLYAIGAVLAVWLHPTSVAALVAINGGALVALAVRQLDGAAFRRWVGLNVVVALCCLPLVPGLLWPPSGGAATDWIPRLSRWTLESVIGETLAGPASLAHAQRIAEVAALCGAVLFLVPRWRPGWRAGIVLAVVPLLALALMIGISAAKPILLSRTLAWLLLPLAVAVGAVLSRRPPVLGVAVTAAVAVALLAQMVRGTALKEDWPGLFAQMPDLSAPTLVVLAPHTPPGAVAVYGPAGVAPVRLDDGIPVPETTVMPRLFGTPTIDVAELASRIRAGEPVWLVFRRPEYDWVKRSIAGLPPATLTRQSEPGTNPSLTALFWSQADAVKSGSSL